jgi:hypothetical protein
VTYLWTPKRCKLTSRVKRINVNTQVHGLSGTNPVPNLLDDAIGADLVNLPGFHNLKSTVTIVLVVGRTRQCRADAGMDVGVVGKEAFLSSVEEVGSVVDSGLLTGGAAEDLGLPGVTNDFIRCCRSIAFMEQLTDGCRSESH